MDKHFERFEEEHRKCRTAQPVRQSDTRCVCAAGPCIPPEQSRGHHTAFSCVPRRSIRHFKHNLPEVVSWPTPHDRIIFPGNSHIASDGMLLVTTYYPLPLFAFDGVPGKSQSAFVKLSSGVTLGKFPGYCRTIGPVLRQEDRIVSERPERVRSERMDVRVRSLRVSSTRT